MHSSGRECTWMVPSRSKIASNQAKRERSVAPRRGVMAQVEAADSGRKNLAERALSLLADVRAGEGAGVLLLGLNVFLLLVSYYLLKTVREPLILTQGGAEVKTYSAAGQALLLLAIVPAYGAFASRVSRIRLITW